MDPILIVDDESDNLNALRRLLRNHYDINTSISPVDALKLVMTRTFHVIISDQRMPEMTGVEFLEKAKNVQPNATRILLTGYTDLDSVIGAVNRGQIYRYVAKPWDPQDLKITLRQANEAFLLRKELEATNSELVRKNTDLATAMKALELLDAAKSRFLSLVSHELNTPLTALVSYVPLLLEQTEGLSIEAKKSARAIEGATARLTRIVQEVVGYVRIESTPGLSFHKVNLDTLITQSVESMKCEIAEKNLEVKVIGDRAVVVDADHYRLSLALSKLIGDFVARAPAKTAVMIETSVAGAHAVVLISRSGEALSKQALEPLDFASDPLKHTHSMGLALALCKSVVEAHGGTMSVVDSKPIAMIEITLPLLRP